MEASNRVLDVRVGRRMGLDQEVPHNFNLKTILVLPVYRNAIGCRGEAESQVSSKTRFDITQFGKLTLSTSAGGPRR